LNQGYSSNGEEELSAVEEEPEAVRQDVRHLTFRKSVFLAKSILGPHPERTPPTAAARNARIPALGPLSG
jgi:hypothetical protein